jgi:hypothetical protein
MVLAKALPYFSASLLTFESGRTSLAAAELAATGIDEPIDDEDDCAAAELDEPVDDEDGCGLDDAPVRTGDVLLLALRALSLAFRASFSDNDDDDDDAAEETFFFAKRALSYSAFATLIKIAASLAAAELAATGINEPIDDEDDCAAAELDEPVDDEDGCGLDDAPVRTGDVLLLALRALSFAFHASFSDNDDDDDDAAEETFFFAKRALSYSAFDTLIKIAVSSISCSAATTLSTRLIFCPAVLATSEVTGGGDDPSILHVVEEDGWTGVLRKVFL